MIAYNTALVVSLQRMQTQERPSTSVEAPYAGVKITNPPTRPSAEDGMIALSTLHPIMPWKSLGPSICGSTTPSRQQTHSISLSPVSETFPVSHPRPKKVPDCLAMYSQWPIALMETRDCCRSLWIFGHVRCKYD